MKQVEEEQQFFYIRKKPGQVHKKERKYAVMTDVFFLFLFLEGFGIGLLSMFQVKAYLLVLSAANGIIAFLLSLLFYAEKKVKRTGIGIWCVSFLLFFLVFHQWMESGINLILNHIMDTIGNEYPYLLPFYTVNVIEEDQIYAVTAVLVWSAGIFAILGEYLIFTGNRILLGVWVLILLFFQGITGIYPSLLWNIAMLAAWFAVWIRGHGEKVEQGKQRFALLGQILYCSVGVLAVLAILQIFFPFKSYEKNETVLSLKTALSEDIDKWRYGSSKVLPKGDFRNLGSFKTSETPVLEITMSRPESYYLRGFTGSTYKGSGWEGMDKKERWKNNDLFYWMHGSGFFGQEMLGMAGDVLDSKIREEESNVITVNNLRADRQYAYVPYELLTKGKTNLNLQGQLIGDEGVMTRGLKGERRYIYEAVSNQVTQYPRLTASLLNEENLTEEGKEYKRLEGYYNEFVYKNNLDIPENLRIELKKLIGESKVREGEKHADYKEAKETILYFLNSNCRYSEELSEEWNGTDLINDFLNRTKKGYSVHYASAAVMLFRYYGIPARYVEGYLITPDDVKAMSPEKPYLLDETHAHAWVEYYQDGVGWLPFETTPSYMNTMDQAEQYKDISELTGQSSENQMPEQEQEEEKEEKEEEEPEIDWLFILEIILFTAIILMLAVLLSIIGWVMIKRHKSKKAKKLFESADCRVAVKSLFNYTMNILAAAGLNVNNASLFSYEQQIGRMFDADIQRQYKEIVAIRQEAVYSTHDITKEQREELVRFKDCIWNRVYQSGGLLQKLQLKYIYFL